MKAFLPIAAGALALTSLSAPASAGSWRHADDYGWRGPSVSVEVAPAYRTRHVYRPRYVASRCKVTRIWRAGELRVIRSCREPFKSYGVRRTFRRDDVDGRRFYEGRRFRDRDSYYGHRRWSDWD